MISEQTYKKLGKKLNIPYSLKSKNIINDKLVELKMGKYTGKWTVSSFWDTPTSKLKQTLAQYGIKIESDIELDEQKIKNFVGECEPLNLIGSNELYKSIQAFDPEVQKANVEKFVKSNKGKFKSINSAIKLWFTTRQKV